MKKLLSIILALLMLLPTAYAASADETGITKYGAENLTYEILKDKDGNATGNVSVTGYSDETIKTSSFGISVPETGKEHITEIPSKVTLDADGKYDANGTEYTVTQIGKTAFGSLSTKNTEFRDLNCTGMILPETITVIGGYAFAFMKFLKTVDIRMNDGTLKTDILLPPNLKQLDPAAFKTNNALTTPLVVPGTLRKIDSEAFACDSGNIPTVVIQDGVGIIRPSAFRNASFSEVTIPASVFEIHINAFSRCKNLGKIIFKHSDDNAIATGKIQNFGTGEDIGGWNKSDTNAGGCLGGNLRTSGYTKFYSESITMLKNLQTKFNGKFGIEKSGTADNDYYLNNNFVYGDGTDKTYDIGDFNYKSIRMKFNSSDADDADNTAFLAQLNGFAGAQNPTEGKIFDGNNLFLEAGDKSYKFEIDSVASTAFKKTNMIKGFIATDSLTEIGDEAFFNTRLEDVYFGKNLKTLATNAFGGSSLGYMIVPESVDAEKYNLLGDMKKLRYLIYEGTTLPNNWECKNLNIGAQLYGDVYICVRSDALAKYNADNGTEYKDNDILRASSCTKESANVILKVLNDTPIADYLQYANNYRKAFIYNPSSADLSAAYAAADFGAELNKYDNCYFKGNITVKAGSVWTADTTGFTPKADGGTKVKVMLFDSVETITPLTVVKEIRPW